MEFLDDCEVSSDESGDGLSIFDEDTDGSFINDEESDDLNSPPYKKVVTSTEKLSLQDGARPSSGVARQLFSQNGGQSPPKQQNGGGSALDIVAEAVRESQVDLSHSVGATLGEDGSLFYELSEQRTEEIQQVLSCVEDVPREFPEAQPEPTLTGERRLRYLFTDIFGKEEQVRFTDIHKAMMNVKTMQQLWGIFVERPKTGKRQGPERCHIALEALLVSSADKYRVKATECGYYFLAQFEKGSRSEAGLRKILAQLGIKDALIGVPQIRKPAVKTWLKENTTCLSQDTELTCMKEEQTTSAKVVGDDTLIKFDMDQLIQFCEDHEPPTVERLICLYREEAKNGDTNAIAWRSATGCLQHAKNAFTLYESAEKGRVMGMTMPEYLDYRIQKFQGGNKMQVDKLLLYQGVLPQFFAQEFFEWTKGRIKRNTIVFVGKGDTGKSMMMDAIMQVLGGAFLSYHQDNQHWKGPAIGKRFCCIDDITDYQWSRIDLTERRALDGGTVTINGKYRSQVETKFPPVMITTNYDLRENKNQLGQLNFEYLVNRLQWIKFDKVLIKKANGAAAIPVTPADFAAWLAHYETAWREAYQPDTE